MSQGDSLSDVILALSKSKSADGPAEDEGGSEIDMNTIAFFY